MPIVYQAENRMFFLDGKGFTYAFYINPADYAEHLYFGKPIAHDDITYTRAIGATSSAVTAPGKDGSAWNSYTHFPAEFSFFGSGDFREPTVLLENPAGDRMSDLLYDGYEILEEKPTIPGMPSLRGGETLLLHLRDRVSGFRADLYYTVYPDVSVLCRHIVYRNETSGTVRLRRAYSFSCALPTGEYDMTSFFGAWARERTPERVPLHHGVASVDSKRTSSSHVLNPFITVSNRAASETAGNVYGFSLVYSSSYVLKAEVTSSGEIQICGGINDFDFSWKLEVGESFATPEVVMAYSPAGFGEMSRAYHDAFRTYLIPRRYVMARRPVLINNWEGTYFSFDNEKLMAIVDAAAKTGIDTFVLDDGWFGKRDNDCSGLGDWVVNKKKLAGGLSTIIDYVHERGMQFGLWFEPEMVSEDSDLYRAHPDWAIAVPGREHARSRHQLVLDITRPEVRDYLVDAVSRVLDEHRIEYVKWDCNRNVAQAYSAALPADRQSEFAHRYALGLYDLCERIVNGHPDVLFEGCSGGGMRFDPAMLAYFPQIWASDDTDAEERVRIQYGTSFAYPLSAISAHVSVCPNHQTGRTTPFATRSDIAHLGPTGYELNAAALPPEELSAMKEQILAYREMADLVLQGDLYRTDDPFCSNYAGFLLVSKDKTEAIFTAYRRLVIPAGETKRFCLQGLDPARRYEVREMNGTFAGSTLMNVGIPVPFAYCDFTSYVYHIRAV